MGLIDSSRPRPFRPSGGLLAPADDATSTDSIYMDTLGGEGSAGLGAVHGKGYQDMTPAEFGKTAQDRGNRGFIERNLPSLFAGSGLLGKGLSMLDDSMFNAELANRSQAFTGMGQPMPDDYMSQAFAGGGGAPGGPTGGGVSAADLGASLAEGNTTGMFNKGGKVGKRGLLDIDPPGPDNVVVGAETGERMIPDEMFSGFSKSTKAEIEAALKKVRK